MKTLLSLAPGLSPKGKTSLAQRLLLYRGELYRIPASYERLRVVDGVAFVTQAARDRILTPGHEMALEHHADIALVSPLRGEQLVVELYGK
jgi:hypothetical protein